MVNNLIKKINISNLTKIYKEYRMSLFLLLITILCVVLYMRLYKNNTLNNTLMIEGFEDGDVMELNLNDVVTQGNLDTKINEQLNDSETGNLKFYTKTDIDTKLETYLTKDDASLTYLPLGTGTNSFITQRQLNNYVKKNDLNDELDDKLDNKVNDLIKPGSESDTKTTLESIINYLASSIFSGRTMAIDTISTTSDESGTVFEEPAFQINTTKPDLRGNWSTWLNDFGERYLDTVKDIFNSLHITNTESSESSSYLALRDLRLTTILSASGMENLFKQNKFHNKLIYLIYRLDEEIKGTTSGGTTKKGPYSNWDGDGEIGNDRNQNSDGKQQKSGRFFGLFLRQIKKKNAHSKFKGLLNNNAYLGNTNDSIFWHYQNSTDINDEKGLKDIPIEQFFTVKSGAGQMSWNDFKTKADEEDKKDNIYISWHSFRDGEINRGGKTYKLTSFGKNYIVKNLRIRNDTDINSYLY